MEVFGFVTESKRKDDPPCDIQVKEDPVRRIVRMTLKQIAGLGRELVAFLRLFADCFGRREPRELLRAYVKGQLSNLSVRMSKPLPCGFAKRRARYNDF